MGSFVIFGLGSFGFHTASALVAEKQQVMAIDHDEEKIQDIKNIVASAVIADVTDKRTLKSLGIEDVDAAVISLSGNAFADTVLLTLYLKEIGIKNIIARVTNDDEAKILTMLGATQVIFPEKDMALRLASRISNPHVFDQIDLGEDLQLLEISAPKCFYGKSIRKLDLRKKYNVHIILIKRNLLISNDQEKNKLNYKIILPQPEIPIMKEDILTLIGEKSNLEKIKNLK
jgi:trk system potassium uptake protein TrkA